MYYTNMLDRKSSNKSDVDGRESMSPSFDQKRTIEGLKHVNYP